MKRIIEKTLKATVFTIFCGLLAPATYAVDFDGDTDNTFDTPANWVGDLVPTTDDARIVSNGDAVTLDSAVGTTGDLIIHAGSGASLTINAGGELLSIDRLRLGANSGTSGTLTLNGGSLTALYDPTDNNHVGDQGNGTVNIQDAGSTLTVTQANLVLGYRSGGNGTVTQSAGAVAVGPNTLVVGREGNGIFNQSGGTVSTTGAGDVVIGNGAGATGAYTLSGTAVANVNDITIVGSPAGASGTLNIGGSAAYNSGNHLQIANNATASGTVDMTGGTLTITGAQADLVIGNRGAGVFNQSGGIFSNTDVVQVGNNSGSTGVMNLSGTAVFNTNLDEIRVGQLAGSSGTVNMSDTATINNGRALKVGTSSNGSLVMGDDSVITGHSVIIGHNATGIGDATLNQNARITGNSATTVIGNNGTGTLVLNDDSTVFAGGTRSISVGNGNSGAGTVTVNDNATLSSGGALFLGQNGSATGTIIQNGGRVESRSSNVVLGRQSTGQGTYIMNDGILSAGLTLLVGRANSSIGYLEQNGGEVIVGNNLQFGDGVNASQGTYRLTGGILTVANQMTAPAAGTFLLEGGTLRVDNLNADVDDFQWGAGTLASRQEADAVNITSNFDLTTTPGSTLDLGEVYQSATVLHETLRVNGTLDLTAGGDIFNAISSVNLLRTLGHGSRAGRVTLVTAATLLGQFDTFNGPTDSFVSESLFDPTGDEDILEVDTWYLDYSTPGEITFLYKISNTVPEPSTVGLLAVAAIFLRGFSRKRYTYKD